MKKNILLTLTLSFFSLLSMSQKVWINELDYDIIGADTIEFVELAGIAGTALEDYELLFVNGSNLEVYLTKKLSGVIVNEYNGTGTALVSLKNVFQNGPDGIALLQGGKVLQFISYEGKLSNWNYNGESYSSWPHRACG